MMKKSIYRIGVVLLGFFAAAVSATPISLTPNAGSITTASTELRRIELAGYNSPAGIEDSTQLEVMGGRIFDQAPDANPDPGAKVLNNRARPLMTQAISGQSSYTATSMVRGNHSPISAVTRPVAAPAATATPDNNVIVVPEPPLLLLLGLCLLLVAARSKR